MLTRYKDNSGIERPILQDEARGGWRTHFLRSFKPLDLELASLTWQIDNPS